MSNNIFSSENNINIEKISNLEEQKNSKNGFF